MITVNLSTVVNTKTTTGRTGLAVSGTAVSVIILAVATAIASNPSLFSWKSGVMVVIANGVIAFLANFINKNVPNT